MPYNYGSYRALPSTSSGRAGALGRRFPYQELHPTVALLRQLEEIKRDPTASLFDDKGARYWQLVGSEINVASVILNCKDLSSYANVVSRGLVLLWAEKESGAYDERAALQAYPKLIDRAQQALSAIAKHYIEHSQGQFKKLNAIDGTLLCNGFSKQPWDVNCKKACQTIADKIVLEPEFLLDKELISSHWSQYANAFSKWYKDPSCRRALVYIAKKIAPDIKRGGAFKAQEYSNFANAFSKLLGDIQAAPEEAGACLDALVCIAKKIAPDIERGGALKAQQYSNLANAFSKVLGNARATPEEMGACRDALVCIAKKIAPAIEQGGGFNAQNYANLANAFSKLLGDVRATPEEKGACRNALVRIAKKIAPNIERGDGFTAQGYANLANAFSKVLGDAQATPEEKGACRDALVRIAKKSALDIERGGAFNAQEYSNLANAFSKLLGDIQAAPEEAGACLDALVCIAKKIAPDIERGGGFTAQEYANLANAFSKVLGDVQATPEETGACRDALVRLAKKIARDIERGGAFNAQEYSNLANAFSKVLGDMQATPEETGACRNALVRIAKKIAPDIERGGGFDAQGYANLANAFSKVLGDVQATPEETGACRDALARLAKKIAPNIQRGSAFKAQQYSNFANAFSKVLGDVQATPEEMGACRDALVRIAKKIARDIERDGGFDAQNYANLANAFSKVLGDVRATSEETGACRDALVRIAKKIAPNIQRGDGFTAQGYANLANAFSKVLGDVQATPEETGACRDALMRIAKKSALDIERGGAFKAQEYSNLANAFSKVLGDVQATLEETRVCRDALVRIAKKIARDIERGGGFTAQGYANLTNAFSKVLGDAQATLEETGACRDALARLAKKSAREIERGGAFKAQEYSNLANAFSKVLGDAQATLEETGACRDALVRLAKKSAREIDWSGGFDAQGYANLANAFSKVLGDAQATLEETGACRDALVRIAKKIAPDIERSGGFTAQEYANLANAFSKLIGHQQEAAGGGDLHCQQALAAIAVHMSLERGAAMPMLEMGMLAHAFGRALRTDMSESNASSSLMKDALRRIAAHLVEQPERFAQSDLRWIVMITKAMSQASLLDELAPLAKPWLDSIAAGIGNTGLRETNLETLGNLCQALQPFLSTAALREHRSAALQLLVTRLQPVIARKLAHHLAHPQQAARDQEDACGTRYLALTVYQILKLYMAATLHWSKKNIKGVPRPERKVQQAALTTWLGQVYEQTSSLIEADVSSASWNMIAQIEASIQGDPTTMIDGFLHRRLDKIAAQVRLSSFDAIGVLERLNHPPAMPSPHHGVGTISYHKFNGAPMAKDGEPQREERYTLWHRLTQGKVPLRYVALPGHLSHFMLGRFIYIDGVPHRIDLFGGSKMKRPTQKVSQLFQAAEGPQDNGHLVAVPVGETLGGSAFEQLFSRLLPSEEAFFYAQRALMAAPPNNIAGLGPTDHVLEGRFEMGILPDCAPGQAHPFRIGNTRLRPHDGTGFIKASLVQKMGWYPKAQAQEIAPYGGDTPGANLPSQALQHYRRDDKAAAELVGTLAQRLQSGEALNKEDLFRGATSALVRGHIAVAVPTDEMLVLPSAKSREFDAGPGGLLIGRSPYDQANLRPIPLGKIGTAKSGDATARFLDQTWAMQYSFVGLEKKGDERQRDPNLMFAKGILVVVPDKLWPKAYQNTPMVISSEDPKAESAWKERKQRATSEQQRSFQGALVATELFAPGSLVGMPIAEQKKLEGDFDGDPLLILPPRLKEFHRLVSEHEQQKALQLAARSKDKRSFKPVKTHTSAFNEDGSYRFGRAMHIMAGKLKVLPEFVALQMRYLAQSNAVRRQLDEAIVFSVYEGWDKQLQQEVNALLDDAEPNRESFDQVGAMLEREYEQATHPATRQACRLLRQELAQLAASQHIRLASNALDAVADEEGALETMLPDWQKAAAAAQRPQARIATLLTHMPARLLDKQTSPSYVEGDAQATVQHLFTEGIKKGTDAFKAPQAVFEYEVAATRLRSIYSRMGVPGNVAYDKGLARKLAAGAFVAEEAVQSLQDNPTLAAQVASDTITLLNEGEHFVQFALPSQSRSAEEKAFWASVGQLRQHWQTTASFAVFDPPADRSARVPSRYEALTNKLGQDARALEKHITPLLAAVIPPGLGVEAAPQDRLKSAISTTQKIARLVRESGCMPEQAAFRVKDALRYVFVIDDDARFSRNAEEVLKALKKHRDLEQQALHNTFTAGAIYKGINVTFRHRESGMQFELQLHTAASFHAKKLTHAMYRQEMEEGIVEEERVALRAKQQGVSDLVPLPVGAASIGNISHEASSSAPALTPAELEEGWEMVPAKKKNGARGAGRNEVWDQRLGPRQGGARDSRPGRGGRSGARR